MKASAISIACLLACSIAAAQSPLSSGDKGYKLGCSISASFTCSEVCDELWTNAEKMAHRDRCIKESEERRQAAINCRSGAKRRLAERTQACRIQFPTNPTACLDRSSRIYAADLERCQ